MTLHPSRRNALVAFALALLALVALMRGGRAVDIPRDEAIYFEASRHYQDFGAEVLHAPSKLFDAKARDRAFVFNAEHPPLMKNLAALSRGLFSRAPAKGEAKSSKASSHAGLIPLASERAALRLPAQLLAALGVALLAFVAAGYARRRGGGVVLQTSAALVAGLGFITLPRVAFHATLHTFDLPIAVATLVVVLAYRRGRKDLRWAGFTGILLGLAIVVKHNALFLGPLLALHHGYAWLRDRRSEAPQSGRQLVAPVLVAGATLAPLVALAMWPWLWTAPVERLADYFEFHAQHSWYNMEFGGANYNRPPMPIAYPFVMTAATVPAVWLVAALVATVSGRLARAEASTPEANASEARPFDAHASEVSTESPRVRRSLRWGCLPATAPDHELALWLGMALFPILLIALPSIPIFGGTKHWLTAYPFLMLLAARAWVDLWCAWDDRGRLAHPAVLPLATALVLLPGLWATMNGHPYNLSQYSAFAGGPRGAAEAGLNRGFWGYTLGDGLAQDLPERTPVYLHDIHSLAQTQYEREGRWPGWRVVGVGRARAAFFFYERHMQSDEVAIWEALGTRAPRSLVTLDDVPLAATYAAP